MTKAAELRELGEDELFTRLAEARQEAFNLRFQHATGQLDNYSRLDYVRKEIARISTLLRQVEIEKAESVVVEEEEVRQSRIAARRARVARSRKGVVAGVGREASLSQSKEGSDDE